MPNPLFPSSDQIPILWMDIRKKIPSDYSI
jgi:hypothetical protein